jgi:hypothetical protein
MASQGDKLFLETDKPTVLIQSNHNLEEIFKTLDMKRGTSFELVFKLVLFFNSLPGVKG